MISMIFQGYVIETYGVHHRAEILEILEIYDAHHSFQANTFEKL
jgi:hypothetical protein